MGWIDPERAPDHEGYVVGLIDVGTRGWKNWRELRYPCDAEPRVTGIEMLQAACSCGWRSRMHHAPIVRPPKWYPYAIVADEETEEGALVLWREHVEAELARPKNESGTLRGVAAAHGARK